MLEHGKILTSNQKKRRKGETRLQHHGPGALIFQFHFVTQLGKCGTIGDVYRRGSGCRQHINAKRQRKRLWHYRAGLLK